MSLSMLNHIPRELLIQIFIRIPIESLVCLTGVCKSWHALITNPEFVTMHYNYTKNTRRNKSFFIRYFDMKESQEHFTIRNDDYSFSKRFDQLEFPYKIPYGELNVVGICHGLVCLYVKDFGNIVSVILWNPSIRKWRQVPIEPRKFVLGFGVCDVTNDHKLVKLVHEIDDSECKVPPLVTVYSLRADSWRDVSATAPSCYIDLEKWSQVFFNGSVHWIAYHGHAEEGGIRKLVASCHMGNEVFHESMLPDCLATQHLTDLNITVLEDSLAVLEYNMRIVESCCIWVMKEYGVAESWTKLLSFRLGHSWSTLGFRKDGQFIFPFRNIGLVSYNPETDNTKNLGITGHIMKSTFYIGTYQESLVLLTGGQSIIPRRFSKFLCSLRNKNAT